MLVRIIIPATPSSGMFAGVGGCQINMPLFPMGAAANRTLSGPDAPHPLALVVNSHPAGAVVLIKSPDRVVPPIKTGEGVHETPGDWASALVASTKTGNINMIVIGRMPGRDKRVSISSPSVRNG